MNAFTKIIKNYETIACLGREIIAHKDIVKKLNATPTFGSRISKTGCKNPKIL